MRCRRRSVAVLPGGFLVGRLLDLTRKPYAQTVHTTTNFFCCYCDLYITACVNGNSGSGTVRDQRTVKYVLTD